MKIEIIYKTLSLEVEYKYIPEEKCIRYDKDGGGYPGYPEKVEIYSIFHAKEDITYFISELTGVWREIEKLILEKLKEYEEI